MADAQMKVPDVPNITGTDNMTQAEIERLQGWEKIYTTTHPKPIAPSATKLGFWHMMGLEATVLYSSSISGLLLAAVRTGAIFMIAEQRLLATFGLGNGALINAFISWLPLVVMFTALLAFEGYLFGIGLSKGKESQAIKVSWGGLLIAFLVSAVAGTVSSLPLVGSSATANGLSGQIYNGLTWILVLSSGVGATFMAYLGAENIGVLYNKHAFMVNSVIGQYKDALAAWYAQMQADYRRAGRAVVFGEETFRSALERDRPRHTPEEVQKGVSTQKLVEQYLAEKGLTAYQVGDKPEHMTSPAKIAEELNVESGAVRTSLSRIRARDLQSSV